MCRIAFRITLLIGIDERRFVESPKSQMFKKCYPRDSLAIKMQSPWSLWRGQRPFNDVGQIAGKARRSLDTRKSGFCFHLTAGFQHPPTAKGRRQSGRNLRIFLIEGKHSVRDEVVTQPVSPVELGGIPLRERADQRAHAVWIGGRKCGMGSQTPYVFERIRLWDGGL